MADISSKTSPMAIFSLAATLILISGATLRAQDSFDLTEYQGKVVLLDFWASWCVPCRRSFPWMNEMRSKYSDTGLVIIGVNMDSEADAAQAFLDDYPAEFKIIYASDGALAKEYGVIALPSSFVIGRDGAVAFKHLGFKIEQQDEYESDLVQALGSGSE